jgi:hypothetical protein
MQIVTVYVNHKHTVICGLDLSLAPDVRSYFEISTSYENLKYMIFRVQSNTKGS